MKIHEHDAVGPFESRLSGAGLNAGGLFTVVAEHQEGALLDLFTQVLGTQVREGVVIMGLPDPLDFMAGGHFLADFFGGDIGDVMSRVTRVDDVFDLLMIQFGGVNHKPPLFGGKGVIPFAHMRRCSMATGSGHGIDHRRGAHPQGGDTGNFQKSSSAVFHHLVSFGLSMWQSQQ